MRYWIVEEEEIKYSNIIEEEEFEEDDLPEGFEGPQKGSSIEESFEEGPVPWDPTESFFVYI
jgi:hypothetical protein